MEVKLEFLINICSDLFQILFGNRARNIGAVGRIPTKLPNIPHLQWGICGVRNITESQNHLGWKRPWRSSSPTINVTLTILNYTISLSAMSTISFIYRCFWCFWLYAGGHIHWKIICNNIVVLLFWNIWVKHYYYIFCIKFKIM